MPRPPLSDQHVTTAQRLDEAVRLYWQRRWPGKPGRVLIIDRNPQPQVHTSRKAA